MLSKEARAASEKIHSILWDKFIDEYGLVHDFVGEVPNPEDCRLGRPAAIGWWAGIENAAFFTGLYLDAVVKKALATNSSEDREKARRLADGLVLCASVSDVPGFISRGVGTDGRCHYPLGSDDQTHPWFFGLYSYITSGLPGAEEKSCIVRKMNEVALALDLTEWGIPCESPYKGQFRDQLSKGLLFTRSAARYLYVLRIMYEVSGEKWWLDKYLSALNTAPETGDGRTRLELCAAGYAADRKVWPRSDYEQLWIYAGYQGSLVQLAKLEKDEKIRSRFLEGIARNASDALGPMTEYRRFDNNDTKTFGHNNWRKGYPHWFPQNTQAEAERLSRMGDPKVLGERKSYEAKYMRNPLAAAAMIAMSGDPYYHEIIEKALCHYDYEKLNMADFFFGEIAYWYCTSS